MLDSPWTRNSDNVNGAGRVPAYGGCGMVKMSQ